MKDQRGETWLWVISVFCVGAILALSVYVVATAKRPDELCKERFGQEYYMFDNAWAGDFCTNGTDQRYL